MTVYCRTCREPRPIDCTEEQYRRWQNGALIQVAMPDVPQEQRELLLSGICGTCWQKIFREEQDEHED